MKIAILVADLGNGGAQRAMALLARELTVKGAEVSVLAQSLSGSYLNTLPDGIEQIELSKHPVTFAMSFVRYCRDHPDAIVLSAQSRLSVIAGACKRLGLVTNPLVVREPNRITGKFTSIGGRAYRACMALGLRSGHFLHWRFSGRSRRPVRPDRCFGSTCERHS